ncbi:hypothetical protein BR93DRAFT_945692 [Coniochaeta sp. PMI_546]|nr:hypothetical protein BR93DRAFT_945692 [Coniochaeta sp. PMI_546]
MRPPRSSPVWAIALSTLAFTYPVLSDERVLQQPLSQTSSHLISPGASLNFSSPSPHIFHGTSSLLAQWPNTFFPNGHTLAAVTVPPYTHLYHGRLDSDPPPSPEWLAFDREMSYGIMGSTRNSHLLTYQTTRPVKLVYFDGESAALMGLGQLDSQMLLAFGNVTGPPPPEEGGRGLWGEYERAKGLGWGFEGVVRMNAGFEVIWCDFGSASLRLVSWLNVTAPLVEEEEDDPDDDEGARGRELGGERRKTEIDATSYYSLPPAPTRTDRAVDPSMPPAPPNWRRDRDREPFLFSQGWGWFDSATWHYGSSGNGPGRGEARAKFVNQSSNRAVYERKTLNLTDEGLWKGEGEGNKTLALQQLARRRRYHHLGDMTSEEAALMRSNAERSLRMALEPYNDCSGADWVLMASEIIQQTSLQMKMVEMKFVAFHNISSHNNTALRTWLFGFRAEIHMFTVGFMEYPDERDPNSWIVGSELYNETYSRCRYHYTRLLVPEEGVSLPPAEMEQRQAVEEVQGAICSVMLVIAFGVEQTWAEMFDQSERTQEKRKQPVLGMTQRVAAWHHELALLRAWLGWESDFTGCREVCGWDERCYIPMWPLLASRFGRGPPPPRGNGTQPSPPGYGHPPPHGRLPNGTSPGKPDFRMPPRGPWWMGDDTDLWEPKCVKAGYIMG